ncbi:Putative colanic biosynthesis UDP-glucose lipid carrier transferase [Serratia fonticola]|uniref:undecaprenyl-phosphate glucose phosphotransferase n=1 Tax=Serratia fonticola TaxID=47917 RepID=UPI0021787DE3|nr:undecaprenyl-phosphate glucose phosphotransferase [Serratia fonticola]CAI0963948.1 Putative colanic biosynthesis UDP-glucose lipid carrier transferase [Serratia fonticola]
MKVLRRSIIHTNASIISMLQRFFDISVILSGIYFVALMTKTEMTEQHWLASLLSLAIFQLIGGMTDFYRSWRGMSFSLELKITLRNWTLCFITTLGVLSLFPVMRLFDGVYFFAWYTLVVVGFIIARSFIRYSVYYIRLMGYNNRNVAIVGDAHAGIYLAESIKNAPWLGLKIIGYFLINKRNSAYDDLAIEYMGDVPYLIEMCRQGYIDSVYISLSMKESETIDYILSELADTTCTVTLIPDVFTFNVLQSKSEVINGIPVISLYDTSMSGVNRVLKRVEDVVLSSCILVFISPILLLISIMIKITSSGPVIFKQRRYGIDGKAISVWKFRSMTVMENDDKVLQAKRGDSRITPFGGFLRRTSLDELPQFFNVIKGDMSIVGPRPHAVVHNEQYRKLIKGYMLRHKMKPGITGWAQINGWRGETETLDKMEKRVEFDLYYIQNWSIWLDLKIVLLTVFKGFINKSAY